MNRNLSRLTGIANKKTRLIIGLMSGTSLDGLDVALCAIEGSGVDTRVQLLHFNTVPYPLQLKQEIRKIFAKPSIDFAQLVLLNPALGELHGQWVLDSLAQWNVPPQEVDLIASHGQTVYHYPRILHKREDYGNATLQIGDGDHVAVRTGVITLSDFRQKHIAAGGEGAPLALYGDYCIFSQPGEDRVMLNMGGIANFTYLPGSLDTSRVFVTDTGPGNTLIDALARKFFNLEYDQDAGYAQQGKVSKALLDALQEDDFFAQPFPRTTGPELFNVHYVESAQEKSGTRDLRPEDVMATVTRFSADTIAAALKQVIGTEWRGRVFTSGGGSHNPLLMRWIREALPGAVISSTDELGISGDAKEAVLFAVLANEAIAGEPIQLGQRKGMPAITMGKISFPH